MTQLEQLEAILANAPIEAHTLIIKRNGKERALDLIKVQKKGDKGRRFYGIEFAPARKENEAFDITKFNEACEFMGWDIAETYMQNSMAVKCKSFTELAIDNAKTNNKDWLTVNDEKKLEYIQVECVKIFEQWSIRGEKKNEAMEEMKKLSAIVKELIGKGKKRGDAEYDAAQDALSEYAMSLLTL